MRSGRHLLTVFVGISALLLVGPSCGKEAEKGPGGSKATASAAAYPDWKRSGPFAVERLEHDFGRIREDRDVHTRFRVANVGEAALDLAAVQTSCGCAIAGLSTSKLEPGAVVDVDVELKPKGRPGELRKSVVLQDATGRKVEFAIRARIEPILKVEPRSIYFGRFLPGLVSEWQPIKIESLDPGFAVSSFGVEGKGFELESVDVPEDPEPTPEFRRVRRHFRARFGGGQGFDRIQAQAQFRCSDAEEPLIVFQLLADVETPIRPIPPQFTMICGAEDQEIDQELRLTSPRHETFHAGTIRLELPDDLSFELEAVPSDPGVTDSRLFRFKGRLPKAVDMPSGESIRKGRVVIATDCAEEPEVEVKVVVIVRR